ncbi:MAG: hypothetical protein AB8G05_18325 [Oligoflexales bacterium]
MNVALNLAILFYFSLLSYGFSPASKIIKIRPSEINPGFFPTIEIDGQTYISDEYHIILPNLDMHGDDENSEQILRVFLPGTRTSPQEAIDFLKSINDGPVIGLSYEYLNSPDARRNQLCRKTYTGIEYQNCLKNQHKDAIWSVGSEPDLWQKINWTDSIEGRLTLLLQFLNQKYPQDGWHKYFVNIDSNAGHTKPKWEKIWVIGHSQGAGHAGYLAYSEKLAGVGLISGPQDDCGESFGWISDNWETQDVRVFAHENEDAIDLIKKNWTDITALQASSPLDISELNSKTKSHRTWVTSISPRNTSTKRSQHKSVVLSHNSPLNKDNLYVYAANVWPWIAGSKAMQ